ncbi:kelch-like protein 24 [Mercenaria mercenaria]|uniref:kelch-like protein 24 n=1 Tax=Mercenaria mercenaria TaxID=6596 RepID=UPI00234F6CA8|nr:kelch-like protein 24 [Mercenaria mercenaria]
MLRSSNDNVDNGTAERTNNGNVWTLRFLENLGHSLREQQRSGLHCDVTIRVQGVSFKCHKAILCAVSPYFTAMFAHDMKESRESEVTFHETKADVFELLLDLVYNGRDIIADDNIQDILELSTMMQIDVIIERIEDFLREKLSTDNFIDIWYLAKKYNCQRLVKFVWKFMTLNFESLSSSGELDLLPYDTLISLLKDDFLVAKSEDLVCNAALNWLLADHDSRKSHTSKIISVLRLPLCTPEYIMNKFSQSEQVKHLPEAVSACQDALRYRMCLAQKQNFTSLQTTNRTASRQDDVMVVIGGTDTSEYSGSGVRCYSFQGRKWYTLPPLPKSVGPYYAVCTFGDDIYVSGGQYHRETFHRFQSATCSWLTLPKMINGRYQHAMVAVGDSIYVVGGEGSSKIKEIDEYQVNNGSWESSGELMEDISYANATAVGQTILIFGGNNTDNKYSESVQIYDTYSKQVTHMKSITLPGVGCHTVTCDSTVYVISADGHVSSITNNMEVHLAGIIKQFDPKRFAVVQYRGIFYVVTCSRRVQDTNETAKVLIIDPMSMEVLETLNVPPVGNMPWLRSGTRLTSAKISIGKHYLQELITSEVQK